MKDTIIILGAGVSQIPLIKAAKTRGLVVAVDMNPGAIGFQLTDYKVIASTHDGDQVLNALLDLNGRYFLNYVGILNRSNGIPTITAAKLAKHFNLPCHTVEAASIASDKHKTISFLAARGIPTPKQMSVADLSALKFPLVIKPRVTKTGKSDIFIATGITSFREITENHGFGCGSKFSEILELEEFIPGEDWLILTQFKGGSAKIYCVLQEYVIQSDGYSISGVGFGYLKSDQSNNNFGGLVQRVGMALGIDSGVAAIALRGDIDAGRIVVIEIHLDIGGDLVFDKLLPATGNANCIEEYVEPLLGGGCAEAQTENEDAALIYLNEAARRRLDDLCEEEKLGLGVLKFGSTAHVSNPINYAIIQNVSSKQRHELVEKIGVQKLGIDLVARRMGW